MKLLFLNSLFIYVAVQIYFQPNAFPFTIITIRETRLAYKRIWTATSTSILG